MRHSMTEVMASPIRGSRHRSISPHRRLELGRDYLIHGSSPNISHLGKPPLLRTSTNPSIKLRHHRRQREDSPLLTSRRETKNVRDNKSDTKVEFESQVSPLRITTSQVDLTNTHNVNNKGHILDIHNDLTSSSPSLPKVSSSPASTPPSSRRRTWTIESNKYLKSALNSSPASSPSVVRKKRNSASPRFHFASLPSSRQSSSKSSLSQGVTNTKTVTFVPQSHKSSKQQMHQQQNVVESNISKKEKNVHIISTLQGSEIVTDKTEVKDVIPSTNLNKIEKENSVSKINEKPDVIKSSENVTSIGKITKKSLPEGLSEDVYQKCLSWLQAVRACDEDKCLDLVTQPDLQWKD